ncbi:hypothetical protein TRAPUB_3750 [Trametes pubescens]|uniref:Uncharacterized protein n=1 Tax=Trametes pubescens TaxID=154538 RepID=A0A1M2VCY1_TRAPU|nr:hypothetical protein TRAPUB_3750 [Trametes pubescens]
MDEPQGVVVLQEGAALPENQLQVAAAAPVEEHPAEVVAVEGPPAVPAGNNARAISEADCLCWPHVPQESRGPPPPLDEVLPDVWRSVDEVFKAFNRVVEHLRTHRLNPSPDTPFATAIYMLAEGAAIAGSLKQGMKLIIQTPGYMFPKPQCKNSFERHLSNLSRRDDTLRTVEENIKRTMLEAQPLFEAREKFLAVERKMSRQRARHMFVRAAAILALPFAPILSAALTAADNMILAVIVGVERIFVSEDDLHSTSTGVEALREEMVDKIAVVQTLRQELVAIRAQVEAQRDDPAASRLAAILRKMQAAKELAEAVFSAPNSKEAKAAPGASMPALAAALREVLDILGEQPEGTEVLVSIDDSELSGLDETVAELKTALPATVGL